MNEAPGLFAAFTAGLLSFLSPCVLPLIPSYLGMLAGTSVAELRSASSDRLRILALSLAFSAGFSAVFIVLGIVLSSAANMLGGMSRSWTVAGGIVVILLGLNVAFDFVKILNMEARFHISRRPSGAVGAFLFGAAFAAGWSPCVGPILASILLLAGRGSAGSAAGLLASYSAGLALPFVLTGAFFARLEGVMAVLKRRLGVVKLVSGGFLVLVGAAMAFGSLSVLPAFLSRLGYRLADLAEVSPGSVRTAFSIAYGALSLAFALPLFLGRRRRGWKVLAALAFGFFLLAILELSGFTESARVYSSWLLYQGI
ncbi:MAG: hypothetical protein A2Z99_09905 [Treponema sp. GWB1_62_6]|nr:MAG: hypothetical protein A2Y36_17845 [Treponema sp. GWA1_62_8]OHE63732.1 MAG: hypothetical protein A2001_00750 [Treponema sp. GWC1_61_84]OHE72142.1 MAG: hypothetical protein A2Z99_09905 [Treponema sp. GWB1_62_6]